MFKEQYKTFASNAAYAARMLHYYLMMNKLAADQETLKALDSNARFWMDYRYSALQTVVIFLGKIFGKDNRGQKVFSLPKAINAASGALNYFSRPALKERKLAIGTEFEGLDEYINQAHELTKEDIKLIKAEVKKAEKLWEKIEPLRNKIYAHEEMLTDEEKSALFAQVTYAELEDLVQILLNISHAFEQVELNGRKPKLHDNYIGPINVANEQMKKLLSTLVAGFKTTPNF